MRTVWGRNTSINVQKVIWVLEETDVPYTRIDAGGSFGRVGTAEYRAMNPTGRVPTLQEGDLTLWESNAICRYLVSTSAVSLDAGGAGRRAEADMWMEWFQNNVYSAFIRMFYQCVRLPMTERDPAVLAAALETLNAQFAIAETALARNEYLIGNQLTLGDIPFGSCLYRYFTLDIDRPDFPAIAAYYQRLTAREAYRDAVMVDYSSLRPKA